jgi:hypothetical protein
MEHLTERLATQFLLGRATRDEARAVVRHLLTQCPHCTRLARRILVRPWVRGRESISSSFPSLVGRETARTSSCPAAARCWAFSGRPHSPYGGRPESFSFPGDSRERLDRGAMPPDPIVPHEPTATIGEGRSSIPWPASRRPLFQLCQGGKPAHVRRRRRGSH